MGDVYKKYLWYVDPKVSLYNYTIIQIMYVHLAILMNK